MTSLSCVRGCTRLRRHASACDDRDRCPGCEPRLAEYGLLCYPCHRRLATMLTDAPTVYAWLGVNMAAGTGGEMRQDYLTGSAGEGSPAPLKVAVYDTRQRLESILRDYVVELAEVHKLKGPPVHTTRLDAAYLENWLDRVEVFEWVGDWWTELAEVMVDAHALAPWRQEVKRCHGIPCPECEECALVIFGGDEDVTCTRCRTMIPPERYLLWTQIAADEWGAAAV